MKKHFTDEKTGIAYTLNGDYYLPDLALSEEKDYYIGLWEQRRQNYLIKHKKELYTNLLTSGKLAEHLHGVDKIAFEQHALIVKQMMETQGVTEQLKSENQMKWVGMVNNIRNCVDEIIQSEFICT